MTRIEFSVQADGSRLLCVAGDLKLEDATPLRDRLVESLAEPHPPVIDLRELEDCHPLCLGVLLSYANTLAGESKAKARLLLKKQPPLVLLFGMRHPALLLEEEGQA